MNHFKKNAIRMFAFLGVIVLSLTVLTTVFAANVTDYTNKTTITVDGQPLTDETQISTGKVLKRPIPFLSLTLNKLTKVMYWCLTFLKSWA